MTEETTPQTTASSKACPKCGEAKSATEFYKDRSKKDGLDNRCKPCKREQKRKWREANSEYERERSRKRYAANPEKKREANRKWREANPEKKREADRKWCEANPDKIYARNQEALAKRSRRVARIRKMMAHFDGRTGWLEKLAVAVAVRSDAQGLSWIASDIDELLLIHYYKEV